MIPKQVTFYAHTKERPDGSLAPEAEWEPLYSGPCSNPCPVCESLLPGHGHLNKVAHWTAKFAEEMVGATDTSIREWGYIVGLWHDVGKYSIDFQDRLRGLLQRVDHSTAGAQYIAERFNHPPVGQLLAYLIAGHHAGLADWNRNGSDRDLCARLQCNGVPDWRFHAPSELLRGVELGLPPCRKDQAALFARLLFSCLVDADFLATEAFMNPERACRRVSWPTTVLGRMEAALKARFREFGQATTRVNSHRSSIRKACLEAAERSPGIFTLTVPTGGGKTLSSLAFGIRHALKHGLRRVIYVIPYTSIIEQTAREFRSTFADLSTEIGHDVVLEHHSNFEADEQNDERSVWQLTAENWDAPLIVTTNVQFFESLYANKTSRCRKLHNIGRSVIILDEAQNLPVDYLHPCLDILKQLTEVAGCSVVLCTATQPAIGKREGDFPIGLDLSPEREIVPNPRQLYEDLRRVTLHRESDPVSDSVLADRLREERRVLCIVNTRRHAARLFGELGQEDPANLHLSAQLCPAHRDVVLGEVRKREERGEPCRLVATTVVEAGVDIDFPIVYRAMTGLDSFAQAAGRCNRHGSYDAGSCRAVLFESADEKTPGFLLQHVNATAQVLPDHDDLLGIDAMEQYFRQYYFLQGQPFRWDRNRILECFTVQDRVPAFLFDFQTAAREFRFIPEAQKPVVIEPKPTLWEGGDSKASRRICDLIEELRQRNRRGFPPPRGAHRALQRYTVQVPIRIWDEAVRSGIIELLHDRFPLLTHPENTYDAKFGLQLDASVVSAFYI